MICPFELEWIDNNMLIIIAALGPDVFEMDKPVVFTYEEIFSTSDGFSDSNLLGHGTYGSVYYSLLRDQVWGQVHEELKFVMIYSGYFFLRPILLESLQEVAIKRMTATKTKEFLSEMKVLCKVHHANLVISFLTIQSK